MIFDVTVNGRDYRVELEQQGSGNWVGKVNGEQVTVNVASAADGVFSLLIGGHSHEVVANVAQQQLAIGRDRYSVEVRDPRSWRARKARAAGIEGPKKVLAAMPGKVVRIIASEGAQVEQGSGIIVIEAMKMQNEIKAPKKGTIAKIFAAEGAAVNAGDVLAIVE
jgi:biotin carboxyl carrier protein